MICVRRETPAEEAQACALYGLRDMRGYLHEYIVQVTSDSRSRGYVVAAAIIVFALATFIRESGR